MSSRGVASNEFDRYVQRYDHRSTLSKVQQQYWEAKQTYLQKVKKQEDECVIAADSELDAKLELFKSIEETNLRLLCILEAYQERLCILAHEESAAGRFMKECGRQDQSHAGKVLAACGKALCCAAQQRIQLRPSLGRLYADLDTFQSKATVDTLSTIDRMEKHRTAYRAALLWMKSLSERLDPESMDQLSKFRRVQSHCRRCKIQFERLGVDCVQKVDMLGASRCNLMGHSLLGYQDSWMRFWTSSSATYGSISGCLDRLANQQLQPSLPTVTKMDSDEETNRTMALKQRSLGNDKQGKKADDDTQLISLDFDASTPEQGYEVREEQEKSSKATNLLELQDNKGDDLLSEFGRQVDSMFDNQTTTPTDDLMELFAIDTDIGLASNKINRPSESSNSKQDRKQFLEQLLIHHEQSASDVKQLDDLLGEVNLLSLNEKTPSDDLWSAMSSGVDNFLPGNLWKLSPHSKSDEQSKTGGDNDKTGGGIKDKKVDTKSKLCASNDKKGKKKGNEKSDWFNLFAELDPLANPDAIGQHGDQDRHC